MKHQPDLENLEIDLLIQGISQHYGFDPQEYTVAPLRRRIWEMIRTEKVSTVSGLQERLLHDPSSMERFLALLSPAGKPYGPEFYRRFRTSVVPLLKTYPFVNLWQAGCTTVKDLYSLVILLEEEGLKDRATVYASNMSQLILEKLEAGTFPIAALNEFEAEHKTSGGKGEFRDYCVTGKKRASFSDRLKKNIVFAQHNLATDASFNEFNSILCRDVLSGYRPSLQARAHEVLYASLGLFGILALGQTETIETSPKESSYAEFDAEHRLYRKIR
jgi:chemotaxis protein methyltransferase CheR